MAQFLTDTWFDAVEQIRAEAGDIPVPDIVKNIVINITVSGHPEGDKEIHMAGGDFKRGHAQGAPTKLTLPYTIAKSMFIDGDANAGMQAFMSGQIQVEGDMTVVMQMQTVGEPSDQAKAVTEKVRAITEE